MERFNILGVNVSAVTIHSAWDTIRLWIEQRRREYVCVTCVHGIMESRRSSELRRVHNEAGMVTPDGMPLAWLLRLAGYSKSDRVCGPELMPEVVRQSVEHGVRHFFYGGTPDVLDRLTAEVMRIAPGVQIVGSFAPPFRALTEQEDEEIVKIINDSHPDIVWCGLGMPKQELWMARHRDRLDAPVLIGVGAAFDIHAGVVKRAPPMLRRTGFEWTYRLIKEPRRLWRRYLGNNPLFVWLIAMQMLGVHKWLPATEPTSKL
jgi:N-acetylglucosaminyldiphosphoundecaprenol N-acetyl-beta-D-mannosaminyltransferase